MGENLPRVDLGGAWTQIVDDQKDTFDKDIMPNIARNLLVPTLFCRLAGRRAQAVTAGGAHACVLFESGDVACWGRNGDGQLGIGSTDSVGSGPNQMGSALRTVDLGAS